MEYTFDIAEKFDIIFIKLKYVNAALNIGEYMLDIEKYNIKWFTQSKHSGENMPVGGHDIGLNVWVENGDILFYIDRSGSFDENNQMLKLGRVRLRMKPNTFAQEYCEFTQELKIKEGYIEITGKAPGFPEIKILFWVEVYKPIVHTDVFSTEPIEFEVHYESWRLEERELPNNRRMSCFSTMGYPGKVTTKPDYIDFSDQGVIFFHRNNNEELIFDKMVEQQGLEKYKDQLWNPQKNLTFGGLIFGEGLVPAGLEDGAYNAIPFKTWKLHSDALSDSHSLTVAFNAAQSETVDEWKKSLQILIDDSKTSKQQARIDALKWWKDLFT